MPYSVLEPPFITLNVVKIASGASPPVGDGEGLITPRPALDGLFFISETYVNCLHSLPL